MSERSDALVVFGVTGDLAYKKIFPSLHDMARRGALDVPVVGIARGDRTIEQLRERAREGIAKFGADGLDEDAFRVLSDRLQLVLGDYHEPDTFRRLKQALGDASYTRRRRLPRS